MAQPTGQSGFPTVLRDVPTSHLLRTYAAGPERLGTAVDGLDDAAWAAHPIPRKWSIGEIVMHLADAEIMGAARVRQALAESGAVVAVYDQDAWAAGLRYVDGGRDAWNDALALFGLLRRTTGPLFDLAAWDRTVEHPGWGGPITLRQLLELYADHSERHIAQILERRTLLGTPIDLALLLPDRLY